MTGCVMTIAGSLSSDWFTANKWIRLTSLRCLLGSGGCQCSCYPCLSAESVKYTEIIISPYDETCLHWIKLHVLLYYRQNVPSCKVPPHHRFLNMGRWEHLFEKYLYVLQWIWPGHNSIQNVPIARCPLITDFLTWVKEGTLF